MEISTEQVAVCDEVVTNEDGVNYTINKIGGVPKFLPDKYFNLKPCSNCNYKMVLITQLYVPFVEATYHRVLYVMACPNRSCWNKTDSWCVYRSQLPDYEYIKQLHEEERAASKQAEQKSFIESNDDWGCGVNEWDGDEEQETMDSVDYDFEVTSSPPAIFDCINANSNNSNSNSRRESTSSATAGRIPRSRTLEECMNNLDLLSDDSSVGESFDANNNQMINEAFSQWKKAINEIPKCPSIIQFDTNKPYFQSIYLNVLNKTQFQEDVDYRNRQLKKADAELNKKYLNSTMDDDVSYSKPEEYEKTNLKHGDKIFYKFRKSIDFCPYQAVRYARKSSPLFIARHEDFKLDNVRCSYCNSKCLYEFQLMPALVNYLKPIEKNYNSIEFGTVIVYTCENSCWSDTDNYRVEHVYVQADPDDKLFS